MPDHRRSWRRGFGLGIAALLLAIAAPGLAVQSQRAGELIAKAEAALAQADGIAAEVSLRGAMDAGAPREAVAALMGEAYLARGEARRAREWLEPGEFTRETGARGFRALARLEQQEGKLVAAGHAFDRAIVLTPKDATMWVEIARLRYAGGEHLPAIEAVNYALHLEPKNVRALEFRGQLVRDQSGLAAALPWFERALAESPDDISVLAEYASTLGDLGRARDMLTVTRHMLEIEPGHAYAFYLQAVMAARAGRTDLARGLMNRTGDQLQGMPGAMLLDGVLHVRAGNYVLAADVLHKLVRLQPGNARARLLLARALYLAGEYKLVISDNAAAADAPDASPYLLALVARAHEVLGRRDLAAPLLDRATSGRPPPIAPVARGSALGSMLAAGNLAGAQAAVSRDLAVNPGSADVQARAGDVALAAGDAAAALDHYQFVARVRLPESLVLRLMETYARLGRGQDGRLLAEGFLQQNPASRTAARLVAREATDGETCARARLLLESLAADGGGDVALLAELSQVRLRCGDVAGAEEIARRAYDLGPAAEMAALAWAQALRRQDGDSQPAAALFAKADRIAPRRVVALAAGPGSGSDSY
jgi:tetratricopeptide (TPR) repeat protein